MKQRFFQFIILSTLASTAHASHHKWDDVEDAIFEKNHGWESLMAPKRQWHPTKDYPLTDAQIAQRIREHIAESIKKQQELLKHMPKK